MNTSMAKIAIITSTLNNEKTISRLAKSISKQTYRGFEWLVQDGGSTDRTLTIIETYKANAKIISKPDKSIYDAWNKALERCSAEYVIFLGADDFLLSNDTLEKAEKYLKENKLYFGGIYLFSEISSHYYGYRSSNFTELGKKLDLPIHAFPPPPATFYPRSALRKIGFNLKYKYHADGDMIYNLINTGKTFEGIPIDITGMGDAGVTSVSTNRLKRQLEKLAIWMKHKDQFNQIGFDRINRRKIVLRLVKDLIKECLERVKSYG